jgi:hypothetical protein
MFTATREIQNEANVRGLRAMTASVRLPPFTAVDRR